MIVDTHIHLWDQHSDQYPHHRLTPPPAVSGDELTCIMEKAGVSHAVLIQPSLYGYDNAYIADCVSRHPDRLIGVGCVDVRSKDVSGQVRYWVEERGLRGVRLMPNMDPENTLLDQPGSREVFEQAALLGIPVSLFVAPRHLLHVDKMIREYSDTKVIIEHLGRPDDSDNGLMDAIHPLLQLASAASVYVKLSGLHVISAESYPFSDAYPMIRTVWKAFGSQRMLWGSDFPGVLKRCTYHEILELVQRRLTFLSAGDQEKILAGTARALWDI